MMLIGKPPPCVYVAKAVTLRFCLWWLRLVKRSLPTSESVAQSAATEDCSYAHGHPFAVSKPRWQSSLSLSTRSSEPESIHHPKAHINSATPWRARCCGGALLCPKSARYWTISPGTERESVGDAGA